jgi:hypothetical protein
VGRELRIIPKGTTSTIFLLSRISILHKISLLSRNQEFKLSVFTRAFKAAWAEMNKPKTYVTGDEFEQYVRKNLFPKEGYDLVHQTHDYKANKNDFVETSKGPDFRFRSRRSGREFLVEAKYRSRPTTSLGGILCLA